MLKLVIASLFLFCSVCLSKERFPGSDLFIELPATYKKSTEGSGFTNETNNVTVISVRLDAELKLEDFKKQFTKDELAKKNIELLNTETLKVGILCSTIQRMQDGDVRKIFVINELKGRIYMTVFMFPNVESKEIEKEIRRLAHSLEVRDVKIPPFETVPFIITPTEKLKLCEGFSGHGVFLNDSGKIKEGVANEISLSILYYPSLYDLPQVGLESFSNRYLEFEKQRSKLVKASQKLIEIDGRKAHEIKGEFQKKDNQSVYLLHHCLMHDEKSITYFTGRFPKSKKDEYEQEFQKVFNSLKFK